MANELTSIYQQFINVNDYVTESDLNASLNFNTTSTQANDSEWDYQHPSVNNTSLVLKLLQNVTHYLDYYYTPLITFTGSIGNILSILVFFRTKLRKLSSSYYLAALGISDTGFLLINFLQWLNFFDIHVYNTDVLCQLFTFLSGLCAALSVWFVVAFTVERFIAVLYPLKRQTMCTVRRAKSVLYGLILVSLLHSLPLLVLWAPQYNPQINAPTCDVVSGYEVHMRYYNYYDTVLSFILPLTTIVVLNSFTIHAVWKLAGVRRNMTVHRRKNANHTRCSRRQTQIQQLHHTSNGEKGLTSCTHPNGHHNTKQSCPKTSRQRISNSSQMKVTKMLLIVSSVFVLLNLPSYVLRVISFLWDPAESLIVWQYIAQQFFVTNFGINFVLYCMSGQNFRKETLAMFRPQSPQKFDGGTQVTECVLSLANNNSTTTTTTTTTNVAARIRSVNHDDYWNDNTYEMRGMSWANRNQNSHYQQQQQQHQL